MYVWMWQLNYKEIWAPKNWCFWTVVLEKTLESPLDCKEIQPVHPKGNQSWIFIGRNNPETETPILSPPDVKSWLLLKDPDARKDWRQEEKGMAEDEMVGWHHQLNGYEFEQAPGIGDGQGSLECYSPWGHKELDMTEQLNPLATWCEQLSHWKGPWCWERLKEGGEEDDRGWDDWMASPTQWTCVWATPRNSEGQGSPTMLQSMRWQRVGHGWTTEQQQ